MKNQQQPARSLYRQFRLTCTQQANGKVSYSVYAKRLEARWDEHTVLLRAEVGLPPSPITSTEDVVHLLIAVLRDQLLPGSVD